MTSTFEVRWSPQIPHNYENLCSTSFQSMSSSGRWGSRIGDLGCSTILDWVGRTNDIAIPSTNAEVKPLRGWQIK